MSINVCPLCGWVHSAADVTAVGRFTGIRGYRSILDGSLRATRAEAHADWCQTKQRRPEPAPAPTPVRDEQLPLFTDAQPREKKPVPPFPAARMEVAARAEAWMKFLAQARLSLLVWQIDTDIHADIEHPLMWLRRCTSELSALVAPRSAA